MGSTKKSLQPKQDISMFGEDEVEAVLISVQTIS
jgi:hypothetical protein